MKKTAMILCLFLFAMNIGIAQQKSAGMNSKKIWFARKINRQYLEKQTKIQGDHFYNEEWKNGSIQFSDSQLNLDSTSIRYFVVSQEMHFVNNQDTLSISASNLIHSIHIENQKFICTTYKTDKDPMFGFFQVLCGGKICLLKKYQIKLIEGTKYAKNSFQTLSPDKYRIKTRYFVQSKNAPATEIKTRLKDLLKLVPDKRTEMNLFASRNKLKLKREKDLIQLFKFYNTL